MLRILLTAGLCLFLATVASSARLVCYYNSAAAGRSSLGKFTPSNIDPSLCTHIIYGFSNINNNHELEPTAATDRAYYTELNNLKLGNPQLKTLLAVGGPSPPFDNQKFAAMVANGQNSIQAFVTTAVALLKQYKFDGLNLDWRYPSGNPDNRKFTNLCQDLKTAFKKESPALILSASVSAVKSVIDNGYEIANIHQYLDFINVLTFDFHLSTEPVTAHHSPLYASSSNPTDILTTSYAMNYLKTLGVPVAKLNMGIAAYGRSFTLTNPANSGVGAAASGPGDIGCYGVERGFWSYYETCLYIKAGTRTWLSDQRVPYAVNQGEWVGYDDTQSLSEKVTYINANSYGGACVWSLDLDDFTGQFCQQGSNPFISSLSGLLGVSASRSSSFSSIPTTTTTATTTTTTTTAAPQNSGTICNGQSGVHANPADITTYYNCDFGVATLQRCSSGLVFKTTCLCCDWP